MRARIRYGLNERPEWRHCHCPRDGRRVLQHRLFRQSDFLITGAGSRVNATTSFVVGRAGNGRCFGRRRHAGHWQWNTAVGDRHARAAAGIVYIGYGGAAGVLQASDVQFGAGSGTLYFNHTGNLTFATPITGPGVVYKDGPGTTTLSATNSYTGGTYYFWRNARHQRGCQSWDAASRV